MKRLLVVDAVLALALVAAVLTLPTNSTPTWALSVALTVCIGLTTAVIAVRLSTH